ncbi:hypothetical protein NliqN6_2190 [Naganishia liquefaciens]|uniref:LysM domain-containing protein n=1 Tax=Naganishia liquefaciens TaxID=104408 RepID=A0A8H3TRX2_9TREE|nr:hypothetical protein NliqN6_2190 [Naganishia liquefaciens]
MDTFGEAAAQNKNTGILRNRRKDRVNSNDTNVDNYAASNRGSPHPLLPFHDDTAGNSTRERCQSSNLEDTPAANYDEISRPSLFRLTSDLEREVQAAHVISRSSVDETSLRGSLDQRRISAVIEPPKEVEVIIHEIQPRESLQGIALRYGIELATLRKVNKLWPTDPLHLRRQLYVPLEECRWAKSSDTFVRGPREGQITIFKKEPKRSQVQSASDAFPSGMSDNLLVNTKAADIKGKGREMDSPVAATHDPWSIPPPQGAPSAPANGKVLSVLRIPASELSFFPKNKNVSRRSIDVGSLDAIRRSGSPGSGSNSNSTVPHTVSSPSSLRNSFDSISRPNGRINSMTRIEEGRQAGRLGPTQLGIELLPRQIHGDSRYGARKSERKVSSGWSLNFFSVADDGIDPDENGKIKI